MKSVKSPGKCIHFTYTKYEYVDSQMQINEAQAAIED